MHLRATARPSICQSATKALLGALLVLALARGAGAGERRQGAGLHRGRPGRRTPPRRDRRGDHALGTANDFTVDTTGAASSINAANLAGYRAVVFVHSAGDVLDTTQEAALQAYVEGGGGYVGVGESALLEQGGTAFFNTLTGLPAARITGSGASSSQDVEFLDRVHPATRQLPLVQKAMTETWYTWATSPTGTVHTVARVRGNALPDGTSITNDATPTSRFSAAVQANQPQLNRPAAWCRDVQQGRSFYTEIGGASASWSDASVKKLALGAIQWAVRHGPRRLQGRHQLQLHGHQDHAAEPGRPEHGLRG